jgi:hypothetical protein
MTQDFHGFNFGEAYVACMLIFDKPGEVNLIIGRGSHSEGESVVKQAVEQFCRQRDIAIETDPFNEGRVNCRLVPHGEEAEGAAIAAAEQANQAQTEEICQEARHRKNQRKAAQRKRHTERMRAADSIAEQEQTAVAEPQFGLNKTCIAATVFAALAIGSAVFYHWSHAEEKHPQ